jgi:hypothetical protein
MSTKAEEPKDVKEVLSALKEHSDGTNIVKESIKTFSNPFGKEKKGDIHIADKQEALEKMKEMIANDKGKQKEDSKKFKRWDFSNSPHEQFQKTLDDTFMAFIQWAKMEENKGERTFNVSKAFRRLESYADWMQDEGTELCEPPLTADSIHEASKAWGMNASIDKNGIFAWWIEFGKFDKDTIKNTIPVKDSFRYCVWYSHFVMYNEEAQENGLVFVQDVSHCGFIEMMTLVPMKLSTKMDRLSIGVLPIKMNACYVLNAAKWMDLLMSFMGMFMSKKLKERIKVLKDPKELEEIHGKECVPKPFGSLEGSMEVDLIEEKYFS